MLATLRVMSQRSVSRSVIIGFSFGVVLLVLAITTLYDRSKEKAKALAQIPEFPAPSFPVPALPGQLQGISTGLVTELENHNG